MIDSVDFKYGFDRLTTGIAVELCKGIRKGILDDQTLSRIRSSRKRVDDIVEREEVVYGINTGFGPLCTTIISKEDTVTLQHNILKSHSVGVGNPLTQQIAKLMLILKVHALAQGYSGITVSTMERILWHIDNDVIPYVPSQGSVGASGDLAPLAHLFLPLIGFGQVYYQDQLQDTKQVLTKLGVEPLELGPKEGLALINGTQFIAAHAVEVVFRLQRCLDNADIIAAMNLEAMLGSEQPFRKELHDIRPFEGSQYVANRMWNLLDGSEILKSHEHCSRIQDQYSLRCIPQVHGASRNAWKHLKQLLHIELNSVTDNPIVLENGEAISGGNFHGQLLALPLDYAALAAAEIGNISDRRIYFSLEGKIEGLPKLLMSDTGLNSGFMIPQYTSAALVSENKSLCYPASADSIPTSLGQEDHVSMGSISGRKALQIVDNLEKILAIELICAAQGFDFRLPLKSTLPLMACHEHIREKIKVANKDRIFFNDIEKAIEIVKSGELVDVVNQISDQENLDLKNQEDEVFGIY